MAAGVRKARTCHRRSGRRRGRCRLAGQTPSDVGPPPLHGPDDAFREHPPISVARLRNRRASWRRLSDVRRRREDHICATLLPRLNTSLLFYGGCRGLAYIARLRARRHEGRPRIHLCRLPRLVAQSDDDADPGRR